MSACLQANKLSKWFRLLEFFVVPLLQCDWSDNLTTTNFLSASLIMIYLIYQKLKLGFFR